MGSTWIEMEKQAGESIDWERWMPRARAIARMIDQESASVLDLGAGQMFLRTLLPARVSYYPVDYVKRAEDTIVCDFNAGEFPEQSADTVVAAGILNFVEDGAWFFRKIAERCQKELIISATPTDLIADPEYRRTQYNWVNHCSAVELLGWADAAGFLLESSFHIQVIEQVTNIIYKFIRQTPRALPRFALCTGCGVCAGACPAGAITMKEDSEGFPRPVIASERCTDCRGCLAVCPALHTEYSNDPAPPTLAVWGRDEFRALSSSGGMFSMLSEQIFHNGGAVCGVRFNAETCAVEYAMARRMDEIRLMRGSKYVQSELGDIFERIKIFLTEEDKPLLFVGCPCQVAALYAYLGKRYDRLYTADFLCAGVNSPKLFRKYLRETCDVQDLLSINFRDKTHGWDPTWLALEKKDGTTEFRHISADPFEKMFHSFLALRKSCYFCRFSTFPRQGDLTIGDFWEIENHDPSLNDNQGTSFVSINNERGEALFGRVRPALQRAVEAPASVSSGNRLWPILRERAEMPVERDRFFELNQSHTFARSLQMQEKKTYDVGVVSNWSGDNYGAQLTHYAFYQTLTDLGISALMIERPHDPRVGGNSPLPKYFRHNPYPEYALCPLYQNTGEMREINKFADTFIVASDQVWNYEFFGSQDLFNLSFIKNNKRKISYATSFGHENHTWPEDERAKEAFYLQQFDAVSVREKSGVAILKNAFGVEAAHVLDPVFLCSRKRYEQLARKARLETGAPYVGVFILDPKPDKEALVRSARRRFKMTSINISDTFDWSMHHNSWGLELEKDIYIEDLLAMIRNSEFVITDSFHGLCFSIIFEKPFIAIGNKARGLTRFESILDQLGLSDRLILDSMLDAAADNPELFGGVDYAPVRKKLAAAKERSLAWLRTQMMRGAPKALTAYDILDEALYAQARTADAQGAALAAQEKALQEVRASVELCWADAQEKWGRCMEDRERTELQNAEQLARQTDRLMEKLEQINRKISEENQRHLLSEQADKSRITELEYRIKDYQNSRSFRIGRCVTWIPRKVRGGFCCVKDHGFLYTGRLFLQKLLRSNT